MNDLLTLALTYPTVIFTTLVLVLLLYWALVLVGALGLDLLDGAEGALEAKGAAVEGALEAKGLLGHPGLMAFLGFGAVPATVALSVLIFWCFALSLLGSAVFGPVLGGWLPSWIVGTGVLAVATVGGALCSAATVEPLKPVFALKVAPTRRQLLGKVATLTSSRVDADFGQASLEDGGAGLLLNVFCSKQNALEKGGRVLLLEYSEERQAFEVEPADAAVGEEIAKLPEEDRARAVQAAAARERAGSGS